METSSLLPKNLVLTKSISTTDAPVPVVEEFLRALTELALRTLYIERFSKEQSLVQIDVNEGFKANENNKNDINRFYVFPFVPTVATTVTEPPMAASKI